MIGPPERLELSEAVLLEVVEDADRIGATHALGVGLYCLGLVQAQLPDHPADDVLGLFDRAIELWSRLRMQTQLLSTLEAAALALALRGAPRASQTLLAAVDARGTWTAAAIRDLLAAPLSVLTPAEREACQRRGAAFLTVDDAARYARFAIAEFRAR